MTSQVSDPRPAWAKWLDRISNAADSSGKPCGDSHISADKTCRVDDQPNGGTSPANPYPNRKWTFSGSEKIGKVTAPTASKWRKAPGDFTSAAQAAGFYAKQQGKPMMIVRGNSYGAKVWQIMPIDDDIHKATVHGDEHSIAIVHPDGDVFQVRAVKTKAT